MKLEFFLESELDLTDAANFYDNRLRGLGKDFVTEVERVTRVLLELHSLGDKVDPIHRRIPLQRFPYALIYRVDADVLRIVAVAHWRKQPNYWYSRIQDR